ncbi:MAG TPA: ATP-binding protein [Candidatus Atribacteria bacterium]|mgnify:CR=1 FL=1|nr:ATP-binding protein [Candidatus Atribacteria bacterium]HPT77764.1 ATP-binding protein [Candidatus Atribacteria bacterium]
MLTDDRENIIELSYPVSPNDFSAAGDVSSKVKMLLKHLGIDAAIVRRAAIACYEAELNLVIHSYGGSITLIVSPKEIIIKAEDTGPGIPDIELAMTAGYSTAPEAARELGFGAGMGLPNIKRCADMFDIQSQVGQGTLLTIIIHHD